MDKMRRDELPLLRLLYNTSPINNINTSLNNIL